MQFLAIVNRFIVKTYLNSIFTNDLKENKKNRKISKVTDYAALKVFANQNCTCGCFRFNPIREGMKTVEADEIWQLLYKHVNNNYSSFKQAFLQFDIVSILQQLFLLQTGIPTV